MTGWFDPLNLAAVALRVAISTVFGEFDDRRDSMAGSRPIDPKALDPTFDYSQESHGEFWFDYVADIGDGWDSTYAIARLLSKSSLKITDVQPLPMGRLLIFGGDQVYPTASRDEYNQKLVEPYSMAAAAEGPWPSKRPHLYAIPGNHDWYDGLLAFLGLFCTRRLSTAWNTQRKGREIGGRETRQVRSYFALKLPHSWWLWGVDSQFEGYIDQPQIDFFAHVSREWMPNDAKLIICAGFPSWSHVDVKNPLPAFRNFSYLEGLAASANRGQQVRLVLSGDSHHYSRFVEGSRHYITCGGGGAFLHPTHQLKDISFVWPYPPPDVQGPAKPGKYLRSFNIATGEGTTAESLYPSREVSRRLALGNLLFAFFNWQFTVTTGILCAIFAWLLHANAVTRGHGLGEMLASKSLVKALGAYMDLVFLSPWPIISAVIACAGYVQFSSFKPGMPRLFAGGLHAVIQIVSVAVLSCYAADLLVGSSDAALVTAIGILGGFSSATLMGIYLLVSVNVFHVHWNEAFSSLRIRHYKSFLRCRIDENGAITVFPVGLDTVPRDRSDPPTNPALTPHMIETIPNIS